MILVMLINIEETLISAKLVFFSYSRMAVTFFVLSFYANGIQGIKIA